MDDEIDFNYCPYCGSEEIDYFSDDEYQCYACNSIWTQDEYESIFEDVANDYYE
jgi:DNA-directed RNA polymerase subunit RPC12/RpoP